MPNRLAAISCSIHLPIEPGHVLDGCELDTVIWSRTTYLHDFAPYAFITGDNSFGKMIPVELLPYWVPRPPAMWLAVAEELRDAGQSAPRDADDDTETAA